MISAAHLRVTSNPLLLVRYLLELRTVQKEILGICKSRQIDLIHAHHPLSALYCRDAVRHLDIPLVLHIHEGLPAKSLYSRALRQASALATRIVCVSSVGNELLRVAGADGSRAQVIPNGVDLSQLPPAGEAAPPEITGQGPHVGVFGVLERRKGHHVLLQSAVSILSQMPDAQIWVVGGTPSPHSAKFRSEIETTAQALGIARQVHFVGHRNDVYRWMKAMDVVVSSSIHHESLSMVALEAMAMGRVVVATRVGGIAEAIEDGVSGFLVPPDDPEALSAGIIRALRSTDREKIGAEAARKIHARYTATAQCRAVIDVYRGALAGKTRAAS
jgi:glycosyltransferase involved in cell wall biosynthesis